MYSLYLLLLVPAIYNLDDPSFRRRVSLQRKLSSLGELPIPVYIWGIANGTPEVSNRCRQLLSPHEEAFTWELAGRVLPRNWCVHPWLYLGGYYSNEVNGLLAEARQQGIKCGAWWDDWSYACRLWVQRQLRNNRTPAEIRFDLHLMVEASAHWLAESHDCELMPMPKRCVD